MPLPLETSPGSIKELSRRRSRRRPKPRTSLTTAVPDPSSAMPRVNVRPFRICLRGAFLTLFSLLSLQAFAAEETPNFTLLDYNGKVHELHRADGKAVVLFFTELGCPIARKNSPKLVQLKQT